MLMPIVEGGPVGREVVIYSASVRVDHAHGKLYSFRPISDLYNRDASLQVLSERLYAVQVPPAGKWRIVDYIPRIALWLSDGQYAFTAAGVMETYCNAGLKHGFVKLSEQRARELLGQHSDVVSL